jgi:hypothetical protein
MAAAVTTAVSFTILQAVDGIALKRAVDAWVAAPAEQEAAAFAAAEAVRWIEIGVNALSYFLVGLTLVLYGLALAMGSHYPRWTGWLAVAAGVAFMVRGLLTSYRGFGSSIPSLVALALFAVWLIAIAIFLWRPSPQPAPTHSSG